MKIKAAKFYQGVHLAGVVRTHIVGNESWLNEVIMVPNMGLQISSTRTLNDNKDTKVPEVAIVPFANVCYAYADLSETKSGGKAADKKETKV